MDQAGKFNATKFLEKSKNRTNNFCALKNFHYPKEPLIGGNKLSDLFLQKPYTYFYVQPGMARQGFSPYFHICYFLDMLEHLFNTSGSNKFLPSYTCGKQELDLNPGPLALIDHNSLDIHGGYLLLQTPGPDPIKNFQRRLTLDFATPKIL